MGIGSPGGEGCGCGTMARGGQCGVVGRRRQEVLVEEEVVVFETQATTTGAAIQARKRSGLRRDEGEALN